MNIKRTIEVIIVTLLASSGAYAGEKILVAGGEAIQSTNELVQAKAVKKEQQNDCKDKLTKENSQNKKDCKQNLKK